MSDTTERPFAEALAILEKIIWQDSFYSPFDVSEGDEVSHMVLHGVLLGELVQDAHCVECNRVSTFKKSGDWSNLEFFAQTGRKLTWNDRKDPSLENWHYTVRYECQRANNHSYHFILQLKDRQLQKIGQFPSLEDVSGADIERYRKVLEPQYFSDLRRAGGLASHGIGIGSFVYLRRIFENLITTHHQAFIKDQGEIPNFDSMRMLEKVEALSSVLPDAVSQYKKVYSILSIGVHELDEGTCRRYFPAVKSIILAILEEDLQNKAKRDAASKLKLEMGKILGELG